MILRLVKGDRAGVFRQIVNAARGFVHHVGGVARIEVLMGVEPPGEVEGGPVDVVEIGEVVDNAAGIHVAQGFFVDDLGPVHVAGAPAAVVDLQNVDVRFGIELLDLIEKLQQGLDSVLQTDADLCGGVGGNRRLLGKALLH